ncbi:MAG: alanine--tRNA ligase [bacterium]
MTAKEVREKFLDFFSAKGGSPPKADGPLAHASGGKGHTIIPSAPLVPENDPTVLFTTAGMHPLVPYLLGEDHPGGKRVANVQICLRTDDIEEIGDNRHLTFFEMLGNWSFGDYFKREAIEWSFELLTSKDKGFALDPKRLYVTVFGGVKELGLERDEKSIKIWQEVFAKAGLKAEVADEGNIWKNKNIRIFPLGMKDNFWGPVGEIGPCGPCTEMYYDLHPKKKHSKVSFDDLIDQFRFLEIWNDVFMEFNKLSDDKYELLKQKNVDTGMGVERMLAVLNNKENIFDIELFSAVFESIKKLSDKNYNNCQKEFRIIADHLKAAVFILAENIEPSNVDRGYVLRRLIRRAIRCGKQIGIKTPFTHKIAEVIINLYQDPYLHLKKNQDFIIEQLVREEEKFGETLEKGLKQFKFLIRRKLIITPVEPGSPTTDIKDKMKITGREAFDLYQTYGFPLELIKELARENRFTVDEDGFNEEMKHHQELSRTAAAGMFKGGLSDHSEIATRYHTATHLLLASLRKVLGEHVFQRGSNITAERLRFDFSHSEKLTPEQIKQVEDLVNQKIQEGLPVKVEEMTVNEAKAQGAIGVFEQKYGERVKVYTIGLSTSSGSIFSQEICGGPHIKNTRQLGKFKIIREEASSAGVRRIKAVLE